MANKMVAGTSTDTQNSKPHPEVFLLAAERLDMNPSQCLVIEDAGVEAAIAGGFKCLAVGAVQTHPAACKGVKDMESITIEEFLR